ncbi:DUF2637 domain-containing protein [Streptomyces sp. NPDC048172]|uniref:DUF2637 domain-containing protein n=1 Tax=Streptomyces sp. NPDC048172 TaxID=3365505 RepID=UPI00371C1D1E
MGRLVRLPSPGSGARRGGVPSVAAEGLPLRRRCRPGEWVEVWAGRVGALLVAGVGAYASYVHQREFALRGGAESVSASLWPLSVDGLLLLATVGLLRPSEGRRRFGRCVVWAAFLLGVGVPLAANIAAAPSLEWGPVLVAGWLPVALLLAVELLAHRTRAPCEGAVAPGGVGGGDGLSGGGDPLLGEALARDARHREVHQRSISAETLRRDLHIGARRARELVAAVRANDSRLS